MKICDGNFEQKFRYNDVVSKYLTSQKYTALNSDFYYHLGIPKRLYNVQQFGLACTTIWFD